MNTEQTLDEIAVELDNAHALAKVAFGKKDLDGYMAIFSRTVAYKQLNGNVISYDQLRNDIASQFARLSKADSSFTRENIKWSGQDVAELLNQNAIAEEKVFFLFTRKWKLRRRGLYTWSKHDATWVISKVEVLEENAY